MLQRLLGWISAHLTDLQNIRQQLANLQQEIAKIVTDGEQSSKLQTKVQAVLTQVDMAGTNADTVHGELKNHVGSMGDSGTGSGSGSGSGTNEAQSEQTGPGPGQLTGAETLAAGGLPGTPPDTVQGSPNDPNFNEVTGDHSSSFTAPAGGSLPASNAAASNAGTSTADTAAQSQAPAGDQGSAPPAGGAG